MRRETWILIVFAFCIGCAHAQPKPEPPKLAETAGSPETRKILTEKELKATVNSLLRLLASEDYGTRNKAEKGIENLLRRDAENFDFALSYLKSQLDMATDHEVRRRLEQMGLEKYSEFGITGSLFQSFPGIIAKLTSPDLETRWEIMKQLAESKHPDAFTPLVKALGDEDDYVRLFAVVALGIVGDSRAVEPLIEAMKAEPDYRQLQLRAAVALRRIGDETATKLLIDTFKNDKDVMTRRNAALALAEIGDKQAIQPLINGLKDSNDDIRDIAALALGNMQAKEAVAPLIQALTDNKLNWRATVALGDIGDTRAIEPLTELWQKNHDMFIRLCAAYGLAKLDRYCKAFGFIIEALRNEDSYIRANAALLLGGTNDKRAIEPLIEALTDEDDAIHSFSAKSLRDLTGQDFDEDYAIWKAWYEKNRDK